MAGTSLMPNKPELKWYTYAQETTDIPENVFIQFEEAISNSCLDTVSNNDYGETQYLLMTVNDYNISFERELFEYVQNFVPAFIVSFFREVILISLRRKAEHVEFLDGQTLMAIKFDLWSAGLYTKYFQKGRRPSQLFQPHKWIISTAPYLLRQQKTHELL